MAGMSVLSKTYIKVICHHRSIKKEGCLNIMSKQELALSLQHDRY